MPETGDHDSSGKTDVETLERHYRITLDFRLLLRPFTPEVRRESFFDDGGASAGEPHSRENVERHRRLYALLLNDERVLERYILTRVAQEEAGLVFGGLSEAFGLAEDGDLLEPLYAGMLVKDAAYFEGRAKARMLWESMGLVAEAFEVEWIRAELAEVGRRMLGDMRRTGGGRLGGHAPVEET